MYLGKQQILLYNSIIRTRGEFGFMILKISSETVKNQHNFWNHIHFHPTDAIEDDWGKRILDCVAEDHVAEYVRMYTMMEDIVTMDNDGNLQYDFSLNDERMDYMVNKGFKLLLCYNFIPACIATDPNTKSNVSKKPTRYKGKMIITSIPKDYELWKEICYQYTKHILRRYGEETVGSWYLQCFNEPDIPSFFMGELGTSEEDVKLRAIEYQKLYKAFHDGILQASNSLKIGGPSIADRNNHDFLISFLSFVKNENLKLDFISLHTYATNPNTLNNGGTFDASGNLKIAAFYIDIIKKCGFGHLPVVIDEWGASSHGFFNKEECPKLLFREDERYACYFAKMITAFMESEIEIDKMMICLSGQHEMTTDFSGFRNFFTLNGFKKPIYYAYSLAAKLGKCVLKYSGRKDGLSVFPTDRGVLLAYGHESFQEELCDLDLIVEFEKEMHIKTYCIDTDHANAYKTYLAFGSPETMTDALISAIKEASALRVLSEEKSRQFRYRLKNYTTMLLEIVE